MVRHRLLSASPLRPATPTSHQAGDRAAIARAATGVPGLDALLDGGFPLHRAIAVCGGIGTGKTTFGLQFVAEGLRRDEAAIFVTVDQKPAHVLADAAALGLDLDDAARGGRLIVLDASPYFTAARSRKANLDARQVAADLAQHAATLSARRLVIDDVTSIVPPDLRQPEVEDYLRSIIQSLEDNLGCTIVLTCRGAKADARGVADAVRGLASGVIDLRVARRDGDGIRALRVVKMRGTAIDLVEHRVSMDRGVGLSVTAPVESGERFTRLPRAAGDAPPPPSGRPAAV